MGLTMSWSDMDRSRSVRLRSCRRLQADAVFFCIYLVVISPVWGQPLSEVIAGRATKLRNDFEEQISRRRSDPSVQGNQSAEEVSVAALKTIIDEERKTGAEPTALYVHCVEELGKYRSNKTALRTLIDNIDDEARAAPQLDQAPLGNFTAAKILIRSAGADARTLVYSALIRPQSRRRLYLFAHVLVQMDQDGDHHLFNTELTAFRLARSIKSAEVHFASDPPVCQKIQANLREIIAIIADPAFAAKPIPPPDNSMP
jgi:hypothetical protein